MAGRRKNKSDGRWTKGTARLVIGPIRPYLPIFRDPVALWPGLASFAVSRGAKHLSLGACDARLLLAAALNSPPNLLAGLDCLTLAAELQPIFDELSAQQPDLARQPMTFLARLQRSGIRLPEALGVEAQILHSLWQAYLVDTGRRSPAVAQLDALRAALDSLPADETLHLAGIDQLSAAQAALLRPHLGEHLQWWPLGPFTGRTGAASRRVQQRLGMPEPAESAPFQDPFAAMPLRLARAQPWPAGWRVQACTSVEQEAQLARAAIHRHRAAGAERIVVLSNDRRYARRLRALLERDGLVLDDPSGWALSTSRAAAALAHVLDAIEQDFAWRPVLDLVKSPFYTEADALESIATWEAALHDPRTPVPKGLKGLRERAGSAAVLLDPLFDAARAFRVEPGERALALWSRGLHSALQALPLWRRWRSDRAGRALIETLEAFVRTVEEQRLPLTWASFRRLLEEQIETARFAPNEPGGPVRLLTLDQSAGLSADAIILSGAAQGQLPSPPSSGAFFTAAARAELGIRTDEERAELELLAFARVLHAAPEVLITYAAAREGEPSEPSPWVVWLQALGVRDAAQDLASLARTLAPSQPAARSGVRLAAERLPAALSASAHQSLIRCPYQFYAQQVLGLDEPQSPDRAFDRRDYGSLLHELLREFTEAHPEPLSAENRPAARSLLLELAQRHFQFLLQEHPLGRSWQAQFLRLVDELLDWLMQRGSVRVQAEASLLCERREGPALKGRIDRLETQDDFSRVVDYKTGGQHRVDQMQSGEDVQASHYALLAEHCVSAEYLKLSREGVRPTVLDGEGLQVLLPQLATRLDQLWQQIAQGLLLQAQGSHETCQYCAYRGVCRSEARA